MLAAFECGAGVDPFSATGCQQSESFGEPQIGEAGSLFETGYGLLEDVLSLSKAVPPPETATFSRRSTAIARRVSFMD